MLNKQHVNKAIDRYNSKQKEDVLIHPISKIDIEIIKELLIALNKLGHKEIAAIMEQYKYHKDTEIQESLLEWNTNYTRGIIEGEENEDEIFDEGKGELFIREFIKIGDGAYELRFIFHYEKYDKYDVDKECMMHFIVLNKTPSTATKIPIYSNETFEFFSEQERDDVYLLLEETVRSAGNITFIN